MTRSFHAFVSGRVQGVCFRFFVVEQARRLGLGGAVRNRPDGRVEVFAQGPAASLAQIEQAIHKGPFLSRVDDVETRWDPPDPPDWIGAAPSGEFGVGY